MGRVTQWLKSLFGIKKEKKDKNEIPNSASLCKNPATIPPNITAAEAAWLLAAENKHAISVAAATATAAAAAAAAAELAVAAVKLTSNGRGAAALFVSRAEQMAAVKIQRNFRGYLGRKALKGLRAVVKLQALMRGILVRKQAKATLHGMEALIRVQNIVRAKKNQSRYQNFDHFHQSYHVPKVKGRHDDTRGEHITTPHSKRLSYSFDTRMNPFDEKPMVVGPAPTRPKSRSRRSNNSVSDYNDNLFCQIHRNNLFRLSESRNSYDQDWSLTGNECRFSTAHSTPRFVHGPNGFINGPYGPSTPANSVCGDDGVFRNYMADTQSFRAKLRCQSAPRPRPDIGPKKRQSLVELMESRNSHSGLRMQRSCSQAQDEVAFKNAVMCKLDRSRDPGRRGEREFFPGRMA